MPKRKPVPTATPPADDLLEEAALAEHESLEEQAAEALDLQAVRDAARGKRK